MGSASAFGELFLYVLYGILLLPGIFLITLYLRVKNIKLLIIGGSLILLVVVHRTYIHADDRRWELKHVGSYLLTQYPNCDSCIIVLTEDKQYAVLNPEKEILEAGDWHFYHGGDAFIVYLNDTRNQLGSGRFQCNRIK